jgi:hypothetical protein
MSETTTQLDLLSTAHNTIRPTQQKERKRKTIDTTHRLPLSSQLIKRATLSTRANGGEGRKETKQNTTQQPDTNSLHLTNRRRRNNRKPGILTSKHAASRHLSDPNANTSTLSVRAPHYQLPRSVNQWIWSPQKTNKAAKCTSTSSGSRSFFLSSSLFAPRSLGAESVPHLSLKLPSFHGTLSSPSTQRAVVLLQWLTKVFFLKIPFRAFFYIPSSLLLIDWIASRRLQVCIMHRVLSPHPPWRMNDKVNRKQFSVGFQFPS